MSFLMVRLLVAANFVLSLKLANLELRMGMGLEA